MYCGRKVDRPLILYGYGKLGHLAEEIFRELKIPVYGVMDNKWSGAEAKFQMLYAPTDALVAVCVASSPYRPIYDFLVAQGWAEENIVPVYDIFLAYPECGIGSGWFGGPITEEVNKHSFHVMYKFKDLPSRIHYAAFLDWRISRIETPFKIEELHRHPLPSTLADIRRRQRVDMFADAPMKEISIHNEGCELKTLEENMHLFIKHRPKIEVSVYHSKDGLYKIERFLMDSLKDYTFKFRLHAYMGQGAYIYCTPKERGEG